jgi:hypothetical protein
MFDHTFTLFILRCCQPVYNHRLIYHCRLCARCGLDRRPLPVRLYQKAMQPLLGRSAFVETYIVATRPTASAAFTASAAAASAAVCVARRTVAATGAGDRALRGRMLAYKIWVDNIFVCFNE